MHRSVYQAVVNSLNRIAGISQGELPKPENLRWIPLKPWEGEIGDVVAVDGSRHRISKTSHILFALCGLAILFSRDGNRDLGLAHVDVLDRGVFNRKSVDDVLSRWMDLAEVKSVLKLNPPEGSLILLDGSFVGKLINPQPTPKWFAGNLLPEEEEILHALEDELRSRGIYDAIDENLKFEDFSFFNLYEAQKDVVFLKENPRLERYMFLVLTLYHELMQSLKELVRDAKRKGWKLVFVSKDSTTADYIKEWGVKGVFSDQVMFSVFTGESGYAPPMVLDIPEEKYALPEGYASLRETKVYQTFVRFSPLYPLAFKVEFVEVDEDEIYDILPKIASLSPEGYPIPLEMAHREVTITHTDMELISEMVLRREVDVRGYLR